MLRGVAKNESTIRVYLDGVLYGSFAATDTSTGTAHFSYTFTPETSLKNGRHSLTLVAVNEHGKTSKATPPVVFTKQIPTAPGDSSAPTFTYRETTRYVVQQGDSLWSIAQTHLGTGSRYSDLVAENAGAFPSLLTHPGAILPGWTLTIPGT
jgi:nucleoid-associated protein YgaU